VIITLNIIRFSLEINKHPKTKHAKGDESVLEFPFFTTWRQGTAKHFEGQEGKGKKQQQQQTYAEWCNATQVAVTKSHCCLPPFSKNAITVVD
jgi:hypothetical protein